MKSHIRQTVDAAIAASERGDDLSAVRILMNFGRPLRRHRMFRRALSAAKQLDAVCAATPQIESTEYLVTDTNGREHRIYVVKGQDAMKSIYAQVKQQHIEMVSFRKSN